MYHCLRIHYHILLLYHVLFGFNISWASVSISVQLCRFLSQRALSGVFYKIMVGSSPTFS